MCNGAICHSSQVAKCAVQIACVQLANFYHKPDPNSNHDHDMNPNHNPDQILLRILQNAHTHKMHATVTSPSQHSLITKAITANTTYDIISFSMQL